MAISRPELFQDRSVVSLNGKDKIVPTIVDYVDPIAESGRDVVITQRDAYWEGYQPHYWKTIGFWASGATQKIWGDFRSIALDQLSQLNGEQTVLDFCGGDGNNTVHLARRLRSARFVIADKAQSFLEEAQRQVGKNVSGVADRVALHRVDATRALPYDEGTFDAVLFNFGSPYFTAREREVMYGQLYRVLRPNGLLIESTFVEPAVPMPELGKDMTIRSIRPWAFPLDMLRAINTVKNVPVLKKFEELKAQGASEWPRAEDLGEQHRNAGFAQVEVVQRLTHQYKGKEVQYGGYVVARKAA